MKSYVVMLRGINVGGRNIKMAELTRSCESAGLVNVKTVLQSGNVLCDGEQDSNSIKAALTEKLQSDFHFEPKLFIYEPTELARIIDNSPFHEVGSHLQNYVVFLEMGLEKLLYKDFQSISSEVDNVSIGDSVIYWTVPKGMTLKSPLSKLLQKKPYKGAHTVRNINTLEKLIR